MQSVRSIIGPRATWLCVAGLMLLPLVLFWPVTLGPYTLIPADIPFLYAPFKAAAAQLGVMRPQNGLLADLILENFQWKQFILDSLKGGEIPLWNPYLFAGVPFLAAGQHSALYPLSVVYYLLPLDKAYGWFTVLNLGLAGAFMFIFMRTLGTGRGAAVFAGIVYQFSGFMLGSVVFQMIIASAAWLPLILAMTERIIQQSPALGGRPSSLPWAVIGALAVACSILAGHIEVTVYTALVVAFYAVWRIGTVIGFRYLKVDGPFILKVIAWLLVMGIGGALIAAVQLLPLFELVGQNFRTERTEFATVLSYGFPLRDVFRWLVPHLYGNQAHHTYFDLFNFGMRPIVSTQGNTWWGIKNDVEGAAYVTIIALIFAGIGLVAHLRTRTKIEAPAGFFGLLSLLSVLFIFGTPLYAILYYGLPGVNQLHSPFRWVFPLTFCIAALAGLGFEWLLQRMRKHSAWDKEPVPPKPLRLVAVGCLLLGVLAFIGVVAVRLGWGAFEGRLASAISNNPRLADAFANPQEFFSYEAGQILFAGLMLILSGALLLMWLSPNRKLARLSRLGVLALAVADAALIWTGMNPAVDPNLLKHESQVVSWLQAQPNQGQWRITAYTPAGTDDKLLNANLGWRYHLQDIRGYDSIIPKQYMDYMRAIEPQGQTIYNRVQPIMNRQSLESPLLDLLGVKYILSEVPIEPAVQGFQQMFEAEGVRVYENTRAASRVMLYPVARGVIDASQPFFDSIQSVDPRTTVTIDNPSGAAIAALSSLSSTASTPFTGNAAITIQRNNEVWVDAQVTGESWLVLNDSYFAGWRAYLRPRGGTDAQEQELTVYRANGNFRAVLLPAASSQPPATNSYTIRFKYSPPAFQIGMFASAIALAGLVFMAAIYAWRNWPRNAQRKTAATGIHLVAKNSLVLTGFNIGARLIDFAFAAFMARFLGPAGVGQYYFAVIIVSWFEIIMNFGLNTYLTREVSRDKAHESAYLQQTTRLRLLLGACAVPLVVLVIGFYELNGQMDLQTAIAIAVLTLSQLPSSLSTGITAVFFAHEKAEVPAALTIVTALIKVTIGAVFILLGWGVIGLAITSLIVNLIVLVILLILSRRQFGLKLIGDDGRRGTGSPSPVAASAPHRLPSSVILRESFPLMINHLLATLFFKVDVPLLKGFRGDTVVGYYSQAYKYVDAFNIIPAFFTQSLFPAMSRQAAARQQSGGDNTLARTYILAVKLLVMIAFPLAVVTTFGADWMIGVLGGPEFIPEGQIALMMMIWSIPIGWINSVTNYALIAANQQHALTRAFVIGLGFNVIANLILIPHFSYQAAALVTIASEFIEGFAFYLFVRRHIAKVNWLSVLGRPALAAGVMALVIYPFAALGLTLPGVVIGIAVYLIMLLLTRALDSNERALLNPLIPARLRRA